MRVYGSLFFIFLCPHTIDGGIKIRAKILRILMKRIEKFEISSVLYKFKWRFQGNVCQSAIKQTYARLMDCFENCYI